MRMHLPENDQPRKLSATFLLAVALASLPAAGSAASNGSTGRAAANADTAANENHRRCEVPPELDPAQDPLPGLAQALKDRSRPVSIVVVGSLSSGAKTQLHGIVGFPVRLQARLASELEALGVDAPVKVETIGRTRATAGELTALIRRHVLPLKPVLVVWLVGRADARQANPPHRFSQSLAEGLDILQRQEIDTILADIQFHPQFEALFRTDDYRNYVRWVAGKRDLPLLRRYEMIEHWASSGEIDLDSGDDADQQASYAFIQECLAFQAARMIVGGAGLTTRR